MSYVPQRLCRMCVVDTRDWNRPIPKDAHNNASLFHSIFGYQLLNIRVWFDIYFLNKHVVGNGLHDKSTERRSMCLFVWGFSSYSRIFHSYEDVTIACEGLQILTYAPHSWPLRTKGSLASTLAVTSSPRTRDTHRYCWALVVELSLLRFVAARIRTPNLPHARLTLKPTAPPPRSEACGLLC